MDVMVGYSGPDSSNTWHKHDVTISEEDFRSYLMEHGGTEIDRIPLVLKYSLMENLAQQYIAGYLRKRVSDKENYRQILVELEKDEDGFLTEIKQIQETAVRF